MAPTHVRTVAMLAQAPGLRLLRDVLLRREDLQIAAVFTHLRRPEGEGRERPAETDAFRAACRDSAVPLVFADGPEAEDVGPLLPVSELDLLICLGWGCRVDAKALARFRLGRIDLEPELSGGPAPDPAFAALAHAAIDAALAEGRAPA